VIEIRIAAHRASRTNLFTLARAALKGDEIDLLELVPEPKPSPSKLMALAS
jgi:hypothetical protein